MFWFMAGSCGVPAGIAGICAMQHSAGIVAMQHLWLMNQSTFIVVKNQ
jgi:hypothetical protein